MARINLMPWREKRRKERQRAFVSLIGFAAAGAVAVLAVGWLLRAGQIELQESRNEQLTSEIELMKKKVEEIQDLDIKRDRLLGRKQVIEELQSNRSHMVHLFDQLVRTVPEGIMLLSVNQRGTALTIEGRSESNSRVSEYLRRLDASDWLDKADLKIIEEQAVPRAAREAAATGEPVLPYFFRLQVALVNPQAPVLDEDGNPVEPSVLDEAVSEDGEALEQPRAAQPETLIDGQSAPPSVEASEQSQATSEPLPPPARLESQVEGAALPPPVTEEIPEDSNESIIRAPTTIPPVAPEAVVNTDAPSTAPPPGEGEPDPSEER